MSEAPTERGTRHALGFLWLIFIVVIAMSGASFARGDWAWCIGLAALALVIVAPLIVSGHSELRKFHAGRGR